jgi:hypothetical protein
LNVHGVNDIRQTKVHSAERLLPEPSAFEVEMAIENLSYKSPGIDQIPAELIKAGGRTIRSKIHKLIISIRNKEQLPKEQKESINIPIYTKGDTTDCSNCTDISFLLTTYEILSNILLPRLTAHAEEIMRSHQCGFQRNRSTTDLAFCIRQLLEKKLQCL